MKSKNLTIQWTKYVLVNKFARWLSRTSGQFGLLLLFVSLNLDAQESANSAPQEENCLVHKIDCVVVTGSRYSVSSEENARNMSKADIEKMPHFADDIFRLMPTLPGVTAGDFSAKFFVRGSDFDDLLVMFDGQQLYRPFHLKDYGSVFSIVDTDIVGNLDFSSGGYSSQFGNKLGGVLDIKSREDNTETGNTIGANFLNAKASGQGDFAGGNGQWQVSARRGYLDFILALDSGEDDEASKLVFGDYFAKINYQLNNKHNLAFRLLGAVDETVMDDSYPEHDYTVTDSLDSTSNSQYFWLTIDSDWSINLNSSSKLALGQLEEDRVGQSLDPGRLNVWVDDYRSFDFIDFSQQLEFETSSDSIFKLGVGLMSSQVKYDYHSERFLFETYNQEPELKTDIIRSFKGKRSHAFLDHKYQITDDLLSEIGLRWDQQNDLGFTESQMSPRVSLAYLVDNDAVVRMSWGHYFQSDEILDLQVADGVSEFSKAQRAEHRILGYQQLFDNGINFRTEIYQKLIKNPKSRFENVFDSNVAFPENHADRVEIVPEESIMQGVEISGKQQVNRKFYWSSSYAFSKAKDRIGGIEVNRRWNQEHALKFELNYLSDGGWNSHLSMTYHSGWPVTLAYGTTTLLPNGDYQLEQHIGERNTENLGTYLRIDLRFAKTKLLQNSKFTYYFEVFNLTNHDNECCVLNNDFRVNSDGSVRVTQERDTWIGMLPSFGFRWAY